MAVTPRNLSDGTLPAEAATSAASDIGELTRRLKEGNEMAYRIFYDAYFHRLWRYLLVVTAGNEDVARESLQATFIRVARHIKVFPDEASFWSWLTVLARSAYRDETRKRRRYFSFLDRFTSHSKVSLEAEAIFDADEQLNEVLNKQIALLPADEAELIAQKYFTHRSVRELAEEFNTTEKAIESKLSRIRRKLKDSALAKLKDETQR